MLSWGDHNFVIDTDEQETGIYIVFYEQYATLRQSNMIYVYIAPVLYPTREIRHGYLCVYDSLFMTGHYYNDFRTLFLPNLKVRLHTY